MNKGSIALVFRFESRGVRVSESCRNILYNKREPRILDYAFVITVENYVICRDVIPKILFGLHTDAFAGIRWGFVHISWPVGKFRSKDSWAYDTKDV